MNTITFDLEESWNQVLEEELKKNYIVDLSRFIQNERESSHRIFPPADLVFNAFKRTPYSKVQVVIMGQDPYHGFRQAEGLSFSVPREVPPPPSLKNIFKELFNDLKLPIPNHGCLESWADQGVLLLNATLTVREGQPMSHKGKGWEELTDKVVLKLCERKDPVIFVLWGKSAQEKNKFIQNSSTKHFILTAPHPSPLSAYQGFFGCSHFSEINRLLLHQGKLAIDWRL